MKEEKPRILSLFGVIFAAIIFAIALPATVASATITVPDDYPTIQAAINAASPGDTVYVKAGTYYEHVSIGKSLTLQGEDRNTTIIDAGGTGKAIYVTANFVTIEGITITNGEHGIYLIPNWSIHHIVISDCIVTLNIKYGFRANHVGGNITIENCEISKNLGYGIFSHQFRNSVIRNCQLFENYFDGIIIGWSYNLSIVNCDVYSNKGYGIALDSTRDCIVEGCNVWENEGGIWVYLFGYGYDNIIRDNVVANNREWGGIKCAGAYDNLIYHNDIISNVMQARDSGHTNKWDNGYPSGGNYWSDYTGEDLNNDGIGDTPYFFENAQDNYPLMRPLWSPIKVFIDIKPGSCPNPLNVKSKGVLPVAVLGTEDFDVTTIYPETIYLTREGYEDFGVLPIRWDHEDVATPFEGEPCDCHDLNGDGYLDMTLKFKTQDLVEILHLDLEEIAGQTIPLILKGNLKEEAGGTSITGSDCIEVLKTGKK